MRFLELSLDRLKLTKLKWALAKAKTAATSRLNWDDASDDMIEANFVYLVVNLKDVLRELSRQERRISFNDHSVTGQDVTDDVVKIRDAACHIGSIDRMITAGTYLSFMRMVGEGGVVLAGALDATNPFDDDVAYFYGKHRILLRRQLLRAIDEAEDELADIERSL